MGDEKMKATYLYYACTDRGAVLSIAYYADTPGKNYRLYYNGSDTGDRFEKLGNAENRLKKWLAIWEKRGIKYTIRRARPNEIPRRGSNT